MVFRAIGQGDYPVFHGLMNDYYREGEDQNTPQEEVDAFITLLFDKLAAREIEGCIAEEESKPIGFALWAVDTEDFAFSEMPGYGTVLEIGIAKPYRASGRGRELLSHGEKELCRKGVGRAYVSAYGPARSFWARCGYKDSARTAGNGLPIMIITL